MSFFSSLLTLNTNLQTLIKLFPLTFSWKQTQTDQIFPFRYNKLHINEETLNYVSNSSSATKIELSSCFHSLSVEAVPKTHSQLQTCTDKFFILTLSCKHTLFQFFFSTIQLSSVSIVWSSLIILWSWYLVSASSQNINLFLPTSVINKHTLIKSVFKKYGIYLWCLEVNIIQTIQREDYISQPVIQSHIKQILATTCCSYD